MSQRGGDVQSHLRLSDEVIYSDLIAQGGADMIISMEPMESLRYLPYLAMDGKIVTGSEPFVNIPNYPEMASVQQELAALPAVDIMDIDAVAKSVGNPRGANMVLLGMAARHIQILSAQELKDAIRTIFSRKGEAVVEANLKAFQAGFDGIDK